MCIFYDNCNGVPRTLGRSWKYVFVVVVVVFFLFFFLFFFFFFFFLLYTHQRVGTLVCFIESDHDIKITFKISKKGSQILYMGNISKSAQHCRN